MTVDANLLKQNKLLVVEKDMKYGDLIEEGMKLRYTESCRSRERAESLPRPTLAFILPLKDWVSL
jgi:hypothetical protein